MGTINGLLKSLDNKVPNSIAKRLDGLAKLNEKLAIAKEEHLKNPTEESQEALGEILEFLNDTEEDLEEDLSTLVEEKRSLERQASEERANQEARAKQASEARVRKEESEAKARREASQARLIREANERRVIEERKTRDLEKKQLEEKNLESDEKTETKTEKKSGIGWGSLLLGGALLVLTGGAVKFFGNKR